MSQQNAAIPETFHTDGDLKASFKLNYFQMEPSSGFVHFQMELGSQVVSSKCHRPGKLVK